jgi:putative DNA primase/helicase
VAVWPDNDDAGRKAAEVVAKAVSAAGAACVAVVDVPQSWPDRWDLADPPPTGVTVERLRDMLDAAVAERRKADGEANGHAEAEHGPDDAAPGGGDAKDEIARLAALDPIAYDRERTAAADRLGIRVSTLDQLVQAARPPADAAAPHAVVFTDVEPWPEPVDAAALLEDIAATIRKHVILTAAAADACALWTAHTWVAERFQHTPRLSVGSPIKCCGKSTLLDVLTELSRRSLKADSISASGVFRTVEALRPITLLVDEADTFLGDNEELRGILNSGFERSGQVIRVVEIKDEWRPVRFATFCPVALAGIGALPPTLEDRAVPIVLQRKAAAEAVVKLRAPGARTALRDLARKLARWAADRGGHLPQDPVVPDAMGDREGDISIPLLAAADDAGGQWPARARNALLDLFGHRAETEGTAEAGVLLLRDIKALFEGTSSLSMFSADIVSRLSGMEERPWPE